MSLLKRLFFPKIDKSDEFNFLFIKKILNNRASFKSMSDQQLEKEVSRDLTFFRNQQAIPERTTYDRIFSAEQFREIINLA